MANNCWPSVNAHFQHVAGSVSLSLFPLQVANTSSMTVCNLLPLRLCTMHDHKSLTLHWSSFSAWGREHVSFCFDHSGGQSIQKSQWCTKVNILQSTVAYLNATIDSETRNTEPEIATDGSSQTGHHLQVDGFGSGFILPSHSVLTGRGPASACWEIAGQGVGPVWIRTIKLLQPKAGQLAG